MQFLRVLAGRVGVYNRTLKMHVRYRRGQVINADDLEPSVVKHLLVSPVLRDGSKGLKRLIEDHGEEWSNLPDAAAKANFMLPTWFEKQIIPAADYIPPHVVMRAKNGRFETVKQAAKEDAAEAAAEKTAKAKKKIVLADR